jgi:hypothetical protein
VIYVGSDDGLVHATTNGGGDWQQAKALPGVPELSFINDIEASLFHEDTVFVVADAHKTGDYSPHVFVSNNRGRNWRSISGDLPGETIAWAIQQDHENENLLFLGTEFGVHFTLNGGQNWHKLSGAPTIAFRDIKIQRRDSDLVGATFGRGIYVLDDYTALRAMANAKFGSSPGLFPIRDAWWYIPSEPGQAAGMPTLGSDSFTTPNPKFGASITYFLDQKITTGKDRRREKEKALAEVGSDLPFPGWDRLTEESMEASPRVMVLIKNANGKPVRWLKAKNEKGTHRLAWDLRYPAPAAVDLTTPEFLPPWAGAPIGPLVPPGEYSAQLYAISSGEARTLSDSQAFTVKPVREPLNGVDYAEVARYQRDTADLVLRVEDADQRLGHAEEILRHMQAAAEAAHGAEPSLFVRLDNMAAQLKTLNTRLRGDPVREGLDEARSPSISSRSRYAANTWETTHMATATQRANFEIAKQDLALFMRDLESAEQGIEDLETQLEAAGAPSWR